MCPSPWKGTLSPVWPGRHQSGAAGLASAGPGNELVSLLHCHLPLASLAATTLTSPHRDTAIPHKPPRGLVFFAGLSVLGLYFCTLRFSMFHGSALSIESLRYVWTHLNSGTFSVSNFTFPISLQTFSQLFLSSLHQVYESVSYQSRALLLGSQAAESREGLQRGATAVTWEGQKEMTGWAGVTIWQETGLDWWLLAQWNFQKKVHEPQWFPFPTKYKLDWPLRVCLVICYVAHCICLLSQMPENIRKKEGLFPPTVLWNAL